MGVCGSKDAGYKAEAAASRAIEQQNVKAYRQEQAKVKLLLLGAGESGKSTIFKQMKILYGSNHGYTEQELASFRGIVHSNIISNFQVLLNHCSVHTPVNDSALSAQLEQVLSIVPEDKKFRIEAPLAELLSQLWRDSGVKATWQQRSTFQVQDSLEYYVKSLERICKQGYIPNEQDVLRARVRTSGIVTEKYIVDGVEFEMYDVGGQRNERKKWIHCFDDVTSIIFVAAISEYDQVLYEDSSQNRLDEAFALFEEICNHNSFKKTSMILFLNKSDLFRDKLAQVPFQTESRFQDYSGPLVELGSRVGSPEFEKAYEKIKGYLIKRFTSLNKAKSKQIYSHVTCATDTKNVEVVFNACKDTILRANLSDAGF